MRDYDRHPWPTCHLSCSCAYGLTVAVCVCVCVCMLGVGVGVGVDVGLGLGLGLGLGVGVGVGVGHWSVAHANVRMMLTRNRRIALRAHTLEDFCILFRYELKPATHRCNIELFQQLSGHISECWIACSHRYMLQYPLLKHSICCYFASQCLH